MVRSLLVFMNPHSLFVDSDVGWLGINPSAGVVIVKSIALLLHGDVGVSAENSVGLIQPCMKQCSRGHFRRHPQPACVQAIKKPGHWLALEIELLQAQIEQSPKIIKPQVIGDEAVELMAMDSQV